MCSGANRLNTRDQSWWCTVRRRYLKEKVLEKFPETLKDKCVDGKENYLPVTALGGRHRWVERPLILKTCRELLEKFSRARIYLKRVYPQRAKKEWLEGPDRTATNEQKQERNLIYFLFQLNTYHSLYPCLKQCEVNSLSFLLRMFVITCSKLCVCFPTLKPGFHPLGLLFHIFSTNLECIANIWTAALWDGYQVVCYLNTGTMGVLQWVWQLRWLCS